MDEQINQQSAISVEALKNGDRAEFARLVELYSPPIYRLALKMLGREQDAEDVLQDTFYKALRSIQKFEERSSLSTWLYRIAMNESLMVLRKHKTQNVPVVEVDREEDEDGLEPPVEIVDWCCLPESEFLDEEARKFMDKAIQTLSPALRAVFLLRDIEGLSVRETADSLHISEASVKTRLLRARLKLREELSIYFRERMK
jgi:RNA polymerase sigma-70 factor (ECF subfamily)